MLKCGENRDLALFLSGWDPSPPHRKLDCEMSAAAPADAVVHDAATEAAAATLAGVADSEPKRARRTQVETAEVLVQKWREALEKSSSMVVQLQAKGQLNATDARKLKVNLEKIAAQEIAGRELFASALARRGRLKGWRSRHSLRCAINPTST